MIAFIYQEEELRSLVELLRKTFPLQNIFVLEGDLGAGKTTFVKHFCSFLQVEDDISSPTFSLVNEYINPAGESIYHMDLYRIEDEHELIDLGFEEYLDQAAFVFIEWPEKALTFLDNYLHIKIESLSNQSRKIIISEVQ